MISFSQFLKEKIENERTKEKERKRTIMALTISLLHFLKALIALDRDALD